MRVLVWSRISFFPDNNVHRNSLWNSVLRNVMSVQEGRVYLFAEMTERSGENVPSIADDELDQSKSIFTKA